ncbi:MAG: hypothetical protein WA919_12175 [Coleofasciculaceae cyanobacterium]
MKDMAKVVAKVFFERRLLADGRRQTAEGGIRAEGENTLPELS